MPLQRFLNELFEANANYSLPCALGKLRAYGGISSLLNSLAIDHRQIADIYRHRHPHPLPSTNSLPPPETPRKPQRRQPELENILLYLITLSFFVKLLLFDNDVQPQLNIYSEVISFLFLIFIIAEKKSRSAAENTERAPEENDDQQHFKTRRGGYEHSFLAEELRQGDIVYAKKDDFLRFDAVILEVVHSDKDEKEAVTVNEEEIGTGRSKCFKGTVWKVEQGGLQDPFLLSGSTLLGGAVWALVCLPVKAGAARRSCGEVQLGGLLRLSGVGHQVEQVMRVAVVVLVGYLGGVWLSTKSFSAYDIFLQLIYLVSCLTIYLSYASTSEFLTSLKKYLKKRTNGKGYRILNHKLLERLGEIDVLIVEDDCLSKDTEMLTRLNRAIDLKIVTALSVKQLEELRFGTDLNHELVYHPADARVLRQTLDSLTRAKFISTSYHQFRTYYLEMLRDLRFNMLYVSRSRAAIGRHEEVVTVKCSDLGAAGADERLQGEWVRIAQNVSCEAVLLEVLEKARVYKRFEESFYAIVINNCLELLMLVGWALAGCLVDLNLNLLVVFLNRNRVQQFYAGVAGEAVGGRRGRSGRGSGRRDGLWVPLEVNLILLVYYIYMNWEIGHSANREFQLFLLLMTNRMFRIEALLRERYHSALLYRLLAKSAAIFLLILLEALLKWKLGYASDFVSESLDTLLLPLILLLFTLFL